MRPWVLAGLGVAVAEGWTLYRDPHHTLSRIAGRHLWLTGVALSAFSIHIYQHQFRGRPQ